MGKPMNHNENIIRKPITHNAKRIQLKVKRTDTENIVSKILTYLSVSYVNTWCGWYENLYSEHYVVYKNKSTNTNVEFYLKCVLMDKA